MPCAAPSRNNLGVQGPCAKPTLTFLNGVDVSAQGLCMFHYELKNGQVNLGGNLFPNQSVEVDSTRWNGWGSNIVRTNAQAHHGNWSVRSTGVLTGYGCVIGADTGTWPVILPSQAIPVSPSALHTWSAWVRSDNGSVYRITFQEYDAAGAVVLATPVDFNCPAGIWTPLSVSAVTQAGTRSCWALVSNQGGATDAFYADDAMLVRG